MKVHFIGIGGIGVSALAQYYLEKGHKVSGSDLISSEIIDFLKKRGIKISLGKHQEKNVSQDVDLVIYSPAVSSVNPELKKAKKLKIETKSYPQALGQLTKKCFTIAVSGTHGKSTVTAMIGLILIKAGFEPTVILGTKLKEFGQTNFRMGKSTYLVIEADEWQASFLNYWPRIIVLTNIEKEHLDYYKNMEHILKTYGEFIEHLPADGTLIINPKSKSQMSNRIQNPNSRIQTFSLKQKEVEELKKILKIPGEHNLLNALAALTLARVLKIPDKISFKVLSEYKGAWRRFEIVEADIRGYQRRLTRRITVISDYAHHPTEILATLKGAREKFKKEKVWLIFQPHQYQRTSYLFKDFVNVFKQAQNKGLLNNLIVTDIFDVAGREKKEIKAKVSAKKLVEAINKAAAIYPHAKQGYGVGVYLAKDKIINHLKKNLKGGEVVIFMGAGDIYKLVDKFSTGSVDLT